jgi:hypothetical protein
MLMMEAVVFSETLQPIYEITRRHIPENSNPHIRHRENLKSHMTYTSSSPSQSDQLSSATGSNLLNTARVILPLCSNAWRYVIQLHHSNVFSTSSTSFGIIIKQH